MNHESQVPLLDLACCLSNAVDLMNPEIAGHQKRVAIIAYHIGSEMKLSDDELFDLTVAGLLHDIGALSLREKTAASLSFEFDFESTDPHRHAHLGALILRKVRSLSRVAFIVRYHHAFWNDGPSGVDAYDIPMSSHILHLADRIDSLVDRHRPILSQVKEISEIIVKNKGRMFAPTATSAFQHVATRESFWLELSSPMSDTVLARRIRVSGPHIGSDDLLAFASVFCRVIDFRSQFTATHSSGVAAVAAILSGMLGFSEKERRLMRIAGYLHDLGKLAIPEEILEKTSALTPEEVSTIKSHPYYTFRILENVDGLGIIVDWAALHHERLDGEGYPFRHLGAQLPLGSRVMGVADVYTALREDRPYRQGMSTQDTLKTLRELAQKGGIDKDVVETLAIHHKEIDMARIGAQQAAQREYGEFSTTSNVELK